LVTLFQIFEIIFTRNFKKPFFVFYPFGNTSLSEEDKLFIQNHFLFYKNLKPKYKVYFETRVLSFIKYYRFVGNKIEITSEMKLLIASTYVKLTFGFRSYLSKSFQTIILYPDIYFSNSNSQYHKGEFNPIMKTVVFSWKHFNEGVSITNDNLNLGLHEFTHVLHIETNKKSNLKALIFRENLQSIFRLLSDQNTKQKLIESGYLRDYAYENQFEFVAVLLEHFFETPQEFKSKFPDIYSKVKQMINYNESRFIL
jgi:MtfA peptidase